MWSAPLDWRRALAGYAGLAAEAVAAIVIGVMIMVLVVMLNPSLARGDPFAEGCVQGEAPVIAASSASPEMLAGAKLARSSAE